MVAAACLHGICKSKRGQCPSPKLSLYMWGRTSHFQKFKSLPFDLFLDFEMKVPGNSALRCQLIFLLCYCEIFYFSPLSLRSCGLNLCGFSCDCSDKKRVTVPRPHKSSYFPLFLYCLLSVDLDISLCSVLKIRNGINF